jgi:hypothetical protein
MRPIFKATLLSITLFVLVLTRSHAQSALPEGAIEVSGYELQSQKRIGRFDFEYTYTVTLTNTSEDLVAVQGEVLSSNSNVSLLNSEFDIGDLAQGAQTTVSLSIQHSRRTLFIDNDLSWQFASFERDVNFNMSNVDVELLSGTTTVSNILF